MVDKFSFIGSLPYSLITKHGEQFVRRALGYITASKTGLTKSELEDILSCDDIVLADEVFKYHVPPIRRLPPLLWTRLRNDLGENLFHKLVAPAGFRPRGRNPRRHSSIPRVIKECVGIVCEHISI